MSLGFAKKIGMTRIFVDGKSVPVTALEFGKNYVLQRKTEDKEGYNSIQIASVKKSRGTKPIKQHVKKYIDLETEFQHISEFRDVTFPEGKKVIDINDFTQDDVLDITGIVLGRGFAGVVKRHGFHGQPASHGHDHERAPGSIGSRWPQRVVKGRKMAGRMGGNTITLKKVKIIAIDNENNLIFVRGSLPGSNSSYLKLKKVN